MKSLDKWYSLPFGNWCGVMMKEKTMKKVAKLLYRQTQELKELLESERDNMVVANWALAYPNGEQQSINYTSDKYSTVQDRINLLDKVKMIRYEEFVYEGGREDAILEHMKLYDENTSIE